MKSQCKLVFVKEDYDENENPTIKEHYINTKCDDLGQWSSTYYEVRNRDMMVSLNLRITKSMIDLCDYKLRYVEYRGKRYVIKQILKDNKRKLKCILDLEEYIV